MKTIGSSILVAALAFLACETALAAGPKTALGKLAATMKPGEWAELKTKGYTRELLRAKNHHIYQYTHDAQWDPKTEQLLFVGQGHYSPLKFISYSAATNSWTLRRTPDWWKVDPKKGRGPIGHAYDNNAIDPVGRIFYHQQYNSPHIHRHAIDEDKWIESLTVDGRRFIKGGHSSALEFFPELGGLVRIHIGGHVDLFDPKTEKWKAINRTPLKMGKLHPFLEYNPLHHIAIFGGGNGSTDIYGLDAAGKVTPLAKPPFGDAALDSTHRSVITVDPVRGDFLVVVNAYRNQAKQKPSTLYAFDVKKNDWRLISKRLPLKGSVIATPVSNYGVVMFCTYRPERVFLYKHK